jgi:hypothetical protein
VLFAAAILACIAVGWGTDKRSCIRTNNTRDGLATYFRGAAVGAVIRERVDQGALLLADKRAHARDLLAWAQERRLSCDAIPQVTAKPARGLPPSGP